MIIIENIRFIGSYFDIKTICFVHYFRNEQSLDAGVVVCVHFWIPAFY